MEISYNFVLYGEIDMSKYFVTKLTDEKVFFSRSDCIYYLEDNYSDVINEYYESGGSKQDFFYDQLEEVGYDELTREQQQYLYEYFE